MDWEGEKRMKLHELKNICSFKSGGTPSKSDETLWGDHLPWVSAKDMKFSVLESAALKLSEKGKAKITPKGSLLILVRGMTLFKNVPVCLAGCDLSFNQDIKALVLNEGIEPKYVLYFLLGSRQKLMRLVDSAGHGTGRLNTDLLRAFPILLPSLSEQKAIADVLSTWDAAIEKTERLIKAKQRRFCGLMQELLKEISAALSLARDEISLLKNLLDKYKTQKRGLMQKLLTGEWRVKKREGSSDG